MFDFAALKADVRQIVHDTMAVEAEYTDPRKNGSVVLQVRWHNKIAQVGELLETGYTEILEGIDRVIFNIPELNKKSVVPVRGGRLHMLSPHFNGAVLVLDSMRPIVGPVEQIWTVGHER